MIRMKLLWIDQSKINQTKNISEKYKKSQSYSKIIFQSCEPPCFFKDAMIYKKTRVFYYDGTSTSCWNIQHKKIIENPSENVENTLVFSKETFETFGRKKSWCSHNDVTFCWNLLLEVLIIPNVQKLLGLNLWV